MWVVCAAKLFTSKEILSAIRIDLNEKGLQVSHKIAKNGLLYLCQHLLVIDRKDFWKVSHLSVIEYFEQKYWTPQEAHLYVGNACLLVLLEPDGGRNLKLAKEDRNIEENNYDYEAESSGDFESDDEAENLEEDDFDDDVERSENTAENKAKSLALDGGFRRYVKSHWVVYAQAQNGREIAQVSSMKMLLGEILRVTPPE